MSGGVGSWGVLRGIECPTSIRESKKKVEKKFEEK